MMHKDIWKVLFKAAEVPPPLTEDRGLSAKRPANPVSSLYLTRCSFPQYNHVRDLSLHAILTGLGSDSGADRLSGPLPEDPADALLTEMLVPVPYDVPEKKAKKKATGTRKGFQCKVVSDSSSEDTEAHSSNENEEEEEENPLPQTEGEKKKKAAPSGEAEGSKKGRTLLPDCSTTAAFSDEEWLPGTSPWRSREYPDTIIILGMSYCTVYYHATHDYAVQPEPISTCLRQMILWARQI